jgi:hypothetical protein
MNAEVISNHVTLDAQSGNSTNGCSGLDAPSAVCSGYIL